MPLDLGLREIGHDVIFVLASGFEIAGTAMRTLVGMDIVFDEGGAGWGFRPKGAGVLAVFPAAAVSAGGLGNLAAVDGASAALADGLQLVLDQSQPAAEVGVLRLQIGDPLLQGGDVGQEGGLSLRWDHVPERCRDRRSRNHTLYYEASVQKVRSWDASSRTKILSRDEPLNSY
jgi:hypothetical protein